MMWDLREVRDNLPKQPRARTRSHSPNPMFPTPQHGGSIPIAFPGPPPFIPMMPGYVPTYDPGRHVHYERPIHHRHIPTDSPHYFPQPQYPPRTRAQSFSHPQQPKPPPPPPKPTAPVPILKHKTHRPTDHHKSSHSHSHNIHASHSHSHLKQYAADFKYSKCTGRKKALCIGINYKGQPHELRGCINDARNVRKFLINKCGYKEGDIVLLTDDAKNPRQIPTRQNMLDAMRWLVRSAKPDDSLFFHYSGHGGQTPDLDGDEIDGLDEVIFPVDFKKNGHIVDDEMHNIMVKPLPAGCRLTALFDACHSGSVLDLPYTYSSHGRLRGSQVTERMRRILSTPADVISWSGCADEQTSSDTFAGGVAVGAMSYAFITALTNNPKPTYQELLKSIRLILNPRFSQKPQLGSSHHIDTSLRFVL